jgi:hypothetical protein
VRLRAAWLVLGLALVLAALLVLGLALVLAALLVLAGPTLPKSCVSRQRFARQAGAALRDDVHTHPPPYARLCVRRAMLNTIDGVRDETGAAPTPWGQWTRQWVAEENRHGDLMNKYCWLRCGCVTVLERPIMWLPLLCTRT